jgi:hypothetical protein
MGLKRDGRRREEVEGARGGEEDRRRRKKLGENSRNVEGKAEAVRSLVLSS